MEIRYSQARVISRARAFVVTAGLGLVLVAVAGCSESSSRTAPAPTANATATVPASTPSATPLATPALSPAPAPRPAAGAAQYRDGTYEIAGRPVTLVNGVAEVEAAPGSASKVTTRYFGNEATGDLNGDGAADVAFLLTQSTGGSGTFFYVAVALRTGSGYAGTNAVLLGDRVAPQPATIENGVVTVNYAERRPGEAMTAAPSVGVSKYLKIVSGRLVEEPRR